MFRSKFFSTFVIPALFVGIVAAVLTGCGGHSNPLSLTVTAAASNVDGADTTTVSASVTNDKNAAGVTWSISGAGTLTGKTATSATYTAPAATSSSQSATITATSVADATKTGTATITVPAAPTVTSTSSSLAGSVGTSLSLALQGSGGIAPYKWAISNTGNALPACLTLSSSGAISFTTTAGEAACAAGSPYSNLIFTFTDSGTPTPLTATSSPLTITIQAATPITLPTPGATMPGPATAGASYSASLAAAGGVIPLAYALTGALPAGLTLNATSGAISGTATKSGTFPFSVTASDSYGDTATQSYSITVSPGPASTLVVAAPASASAGSSFNFTVTAYDANSNIATGYTGTVKFTSSDSKAALPANSALTNGAGTFSATFKTAGNETIKATDTKTASIAGTSNNTNVGALAASKLAVSGPATATAGAAFNVTVTAEDTYGNPVPSFSDKVNFTSTDSSAVLPGLSSLTNGTGTFAMTLKTSGNQTVTGTDASSGAIAGITGAIAVSPAAAKSLTIAVPAKAVAGASLAFSVTVYDAYNNLATGYNGTVKFTSTDSKASLPANTTLTNGAANFSATLKTAGNQAITGTDTVTASIAGTSSTIAVSTAAMSQLLVTAPSPATAGKAFSITVTATDAYANLISGYTGTVHFTSSDTASGAVLPGNYTFTAADAGSHLFASGVTLLTAGSRTITATDVNTATYTGSASVTVNANTVTKLVVSAPATATAGTAINVAVTAKDTYGNTVTTFADMVNFNSSDGSAVLPASSGLTSGTGTFSVTLKTVGNQSVTATDASKGAITGSSGTIAVSPASATHFQVIAPTTVAAGTSFNVAVTAFDAYNNTATAYAGIVKITSSDSKASLPANATLSSGIGSFAVTLKTASAPQTVTATDTVNTSIVGISGNIGVTPAATSKLSVVAPAAATTGVPFNFTVTAIDAYGNTTPAYTGTVQFSSDDTTAPLPTLPASSALTQGIKTFPVTFASNGTWNIKATDTTTSSITGTSGNIVLSTVLTITTTGLNSLDVNQTPSQALSAAGGSGNSANYTWSWAAQSGSNIPPGLTIGGSGAIGGSPTTAGTYNVTVKVVDSGITPNQTATANFAITIYGALTFSSSLPTGYVGVTYSGSVTGAGGSSQGNLSLTVVSGLPSDGLSTSANGPGAVNVGGTPSTITTPYTVNFKLRLTDSATQASITQSFAITVDSSTYVLPTSNPPAATDGQTYGDTITANVTGGSGNYAWIINGYQIASNTPTALGATTLSQQFFAVDNGSNVLTLQTASGTTVSGTGTFTFTLQIMDVGLNQTSYTEQYTFTVNAAGSAVGGQITLNNYCGSSNSLTLPQFTVSINTSPTQQTTTDGSANYSFASVPNGTYNITPSMTGSNLPEYEFYPGALTNVVVDNDTLTTENFGVMLGYTVYGTVTYGGSMTGPIYLQLNNDNCGPSNGTTISAPGSFTIHGVEPGNYNLNAWRDNLGFGAPNASNPAGSLSNITVSASNVTLPSVAIINPSAVTLSTAPTLGTIDGFANGALINFNPILNTNARNVELASSYTVQWSATSTFATPSSSNSTSFPAAGDNSDVWILNTANVSGLTAGSAYYFRAQGVSGSSTSAWSSTVGPITLSAPTAAKSITGQVTWTGSAKGPLYVGFYEQSTGKVWATQVGTKAAPPTSPATYTVQAPSGTYGLFAIIDQNNNGLIDPGDITNTNSNDGPPSVTISGNATENVTIPSANSTVTVKTQFSQNSNGSGGDSSNFTLNLEVRQGSKLPVAVTLESGPNLINPVDLEVCGSDCGTPQFDYYASIGSNTPKVGDSYGFKVTYSDGTTETVSGPVTGVLDVSALATLISPTGAGINDKPSFDWTYPSSNASSYTYQFWLCCGSNGDVWNIPGNHSQSNGFTNSQITPPLVWGVDPIDANNTPSPTSLSAGGSFSWAVESDDSYGNSARAQVNFETTPVVLTLPSSDPDTLPYAILGVPYNGTVTASGGYTPYQYLVTGSSCYGCGPTSLPNGLEVTDAHDNTLVIGGTPDTPTSSGSPVSFQVTVKDNSGATYGPVTYTIAIYSEVPLSLPAASSNPLAPPLTGYPYSGSINASGGPGGGNYSWNVNGTPIPNTNTATAATNSNGLTFTNSGGNTLFVGGTPATAETFSLEVTVTDTTNSSDTATVTYSLTSSTGPNGVNNKSLKGTYVCKYEGLHDSKGDRISTLMSIQADGNGNFSNGIFDTNSRNDTSPVAGTITGTYSIGSDNTGLASTAFVLTSGGPYSGTNTWAVALTNAISPSQEFSMVETDDIGPSSSGQHGTADCYLATTSVWATDPFSGYGFAFGMGGEGSGGTPKADLGRFSASSGVITAGDLDQAKPGSADTNSTFTGSYSPVNATSGRSTFTLTPSSGGSGTFAVYVIDANRMFMIDITQGDGAQSGDLRKQQQTTYSNSSLNGAFVLYSQAYQYQNSAYTYYSTIFQGSGNGAGTLTVNQSYQDDAGTYKDGAQNGSAVSITFDSTYPGRATFSPGTDTAFVYFFNTNSAFYMDVNGGEGWLETGWIEAQTQATFTDAALAGNYLFHQLPRINPSSNGNIGEFDMSSSGSLSAEFTTAGEIDFTYDQSKTGTYSWDSTAPGTGSFLTVGGVTGISCVVISPTKDACLFNTDDTPSVEILQQ
jgi:hypothetical protein